MERDDTAFGDEPLWGYGKNMRNGMMLASRVASESELPVLGSGKPDKRTMRKWVEEGRWG